MRSLLVLLSGLVFWGAALAPTAGAIAPGGDAVTGTHTEGTGTPILTTETIDARSGPSGENPTGTVTVTAALVDPPGPTNTISTGPVTCVRVRGNRAAIGYALNPVTPLPIQSAVVFVEDNGSAPGVDRGHIEGSALPAPTTCPDPTSASLQDPADVVVHDAVALPTRIEQCRHGRWHDFARFRNQGQCLAFVVESKICDALARRGRHLPFCRKLTAGG